MKVDTVKVYKNKKDVTIEPRELEQWNDAGWFTSSQQKKSAGSNKKVDKE